MTKRKAPAAPLQLPSAAVSLPHKGEVLNIQLLGYQLLSSLPPEFQNPEFFDRESGTAKLLQMVLPGEYILTYPLGEGEAADAEMVKGAVALCIQMKKGSLGPKDSKWEEKYSVDVGVDNARWMHRELGRPCAVLLVCLTPDKSAVSLKLLTNLDFEGDGTTRFTSDIHVPISLSNASGQELPQRERPEGGGAHCVPSRGRHASSSGIDFAAVCVPVQHLGAQLAAMFERYSSQLGPPTASAGTPQQEAERAFHALLVGSAARGGAGYLPRLHTGAGHDACISLPGTQRMLRGDYFATVQEKVGSLDHKSPAVQVNFHGGTWSSPLYYQRGQCDLLLMQLPADARCCTSGSGGNLVFAPPARELEARGYFTEPGGGLPRRAAKSPALAIVLWLMPATTKHGRSWPDAAKWIVDLRKEGVFTVLATRAGAADDTDEADLQPYYVDAELARQLQHIVATGEQMAAEKATAAEEGGEEGGEQDSKAAKQV